MKNDAPPEGDWRDSCLQDLRLLHETYRNILMQKLEIAKSDPAAANDKDMAAVEGKLILAGRNYLKSLEEEGRLETGRERFAGTGGGLDLAAARDEIGRRLDRLRESVGAPQVPVGAE